jgi:hypothetical protein
VLTKNENGTIHLEYSTVNQEFADARCRNMTSDTYRFSGRGQVRYFSADNQDYANRPDDLFPQLKTSPDGAFDADRVAAWFPFDKSVNTSLSTADMDYNLTRFSAQDVRVHVMDQANESFPKFFDKQWPWLRSSLFRIEVLPPDADTPPGMLVIKRDEKIQIGDRHEPYPHYLALDPAHDWIVEREVTWRKEHDKVTWSKVETRARAFQQLPNGSWYVSLWEKSRTVGLEREKPTTRQPQRAGFIRMNVKVLDAREFPRDLFNGPAFLAKAKRDGAKIEPN